jgi:hypothetical protein
VGENVGRMFRKMAAVFFYCELKHLARLLFHVTDEKTCLVGVMNALHILYVF